MEPVSYTHLDVYKRQHQDQSQVKLQEHMLDGVYLRYIEFNAGSLHDVSGNGTCEQAADEFRHFDHGDVAVSYTHLSWRGWDIRRQ